MRKWFILIIPLLVLSPENLIAQDEVGCSQLLMDAREAYSAGMVELVPELLLSCIENGLSGEPRVEAYKLVINSYLFDYLPDEADNLMSAFLDDNPDYQAQQGDTPEFLLLLKSHQTRRADEAAELAAAAEAERLQLEQERRLQDAQDAQERAARERAAQERADQEKLEKKRSSSARRKTDKESPRVGFMLGVSGSLGNVAEPYSLGDPMNDDGDYRMAPGLLLGAKADFPLARSLELGLSLVYNRVNLNYSASPLPGSSYEYHECQNRFQIPVSLAIYLNPRSSSRVYVRLGITADYLLSASAFGTRTSGTSREIELEKSEITGSRNKMNLYGLGGLGVNIPFKNSFIFVEADYNYGFLLVNNPDKRYSNQDLLWILYHVDSDFRLGQFNLNFGMTWNIK